METNEHLLKLQEMNEEAELGGGAGTLNLDGEKVYRRCWAASAPCNWTVKSAAH